VLFERLRTWRREVAEAASVPAFVVFTDATLTAIAQDRPTTRAELLAVPGIGATKVDRYGDDVLAIVAAHGSPETVPSA
jgi:DNA helicase-2/ATP-dependent DNA helicase PcrA